MNPVPQLGRLEQGEPVAQPAEGELFFAQTHRVVTYQDEPEPTTQSGVKERVLKHASHHKKLGLSPTGTRLKLHAAATLLTALTLLLAACGGTQSAPLETVEPEAVVKDLVFSSSNNRAAPKVLDTAAVTGKLYIFTAQTSGVDKVDFYLDDPKRAGNAQTSEGQAPFDFAGASGDSANALDTTQLEDGVHTVTAAFFLERRQNARRHRHVPGRQQR